MPFKRDKHQEKLLIHTWADEDNRIRRDKEAEENFDKVIRILLIGAILGIILWISTGCSMASTIVKQEFVAGFSLDRWADSIRITEGDKNYGIKSVRFKDSIEARKICKNTVRNNFKRFVASGGSRSDLKGYIDFLADRYCPKSADLTGNINWKANMYKLMGV